MAVCVRVYMKILFRIFYISCNIKPAQKPNSSLEKELGMHASRIYMYMAAILRIVLQQQS